MLQLANLAQVQEENVELKDTIISKDNKIEQFSANKMVVLEQLHISNIKDTCSCATASAVHD